MSTLIDVARDFSKKPYGRYPKDGDSNGTRFRKEFLVPALNDGSVVVDMSGTNRYGSSFLDEAFAGLVREEGFTKDFLKQNLEVKHNLLPSIALSVWDYIEKV